MKLRRHHSGKTRGLRSTPKSGFTIIELMVAASIGLMIVSGAYFFLFFSLRAMAGVSAQTVLNQKGGNAIEFIQRRVRFATTNYVSTTGNTLTLGIDDDPNTDLDNNGRAFDDRNHYEQFKFIGTNSANVSDCVSNQLVYIPNTNSTTRQVLISTGVRNLPGFKVFSTPNSSLVIIRFGIVDPKPLIHYQAIDMQGTAVSLNRFWNTNVISIYP